MHLRISSIAWAAWKLMPRVVLAEHFSAVELLDPIFFFVSISFYTKSFCLIYVYLSFFHSHFIKLNIIEIESD